MDRFTYADAPHPIPGLTYIYINHYIRIFEDTETDGQNLNIYPPIPENGNWNARLWYGTETAITYALERYANDRYRLPLLISMLFRKCGIPVFGPGSGANNPLRLCAALKNVHAAAALLRDTDAQYDTAWEQDLDDMISDGQTAMLILFAKYKARTFPAAGAYLNSFRGRHADDIPLFKAVRRGDPRLVHVLIYGFGADLGIRDSEGRTAVDLIPTLPQTANRDLMMRILQPRERLQAALMSQHARLGRESAMGDLSADLLQRIHEMSLQGFPE
jgi:hypothetical protein